MNEEEARETVKFLAGVFNIPTPSLRWSYRIKNGVAPKCTSIVIGPKCWRGVEDTLLHEFAHVLDKALTGHVHHSRSFWHILEAVVLAWYRNVKDYDWSTEYKRGRRHGRRLLQKKEA